MDSKDIYTIEEIMRQGLNLALGIEAEGGQDLVSQALYRKRDMALGLMVVRLAQVGLARKGTRD